MCVWYPSCHFPIILTMLCCVLSLFHYHNYEVLPSTENKLIITSIVYTCPCTHVYSCFRYKYNTFPIMQTTYCCVHSHWCYNTLCIVSPSLSMIWIVAVSCASLTLGNIAAFTDSLATKLSKSSTVISSLIVMVTDWLELPLVSVRSSADTLV